MGAAVLMAASTVLSLPTRAAGSPPSGPCSAPAQRPWCNTALSPDARAELLLGALTQDEKIRLLAGVNSSHTGQTAAIDRVGLPSVVITDDGVGVKRLGQSTALPIPMALAATFDPAMARLHGGVVGNETKAKGNDIILGPTVNIMRTPLGGRTFEAYGEDPYLVTRTAVNWIEAAQSQGVIAEVKHLCCNNQEGQGNLSGAPDPVNGFPGLVGGKNYSSSDLDERTLREIYLPQFEAAVKEAHVGTVMCAYNRVNGDWSCENKHLLSDILKGEWGFKGFVVSDWQSTHFTAPALKNGLDLEMPVASDYSKNNVNLALSTGLATQAEVDDHVRRLLRTLFAYGFFDRAAYPQDDHQIDIAGHDRVAQQIEESGITLLKNSGILPLNPAHQRSIALIGAPADRFENGGNAEDITPFRYSTPRQAITQRAGSHVNVTYNDGSNADAAASAARGADVAIVFASDTEGEYKEKACASLDCPGNGQTANQDGLIAKVAAANPNTVVVLETGDPVLTPWRDSVKGVLEAWYPGEQGGTAIARVLFGDVDPGGRLPATFPNSEADLPTSGDPTKYPGLTDIYYKEGVFVGYRWYDAHNLTPAFAFGSGLSYTSFRYSDLRVAPASPGTGAVATVTLAVTNTGTRTGVAVPQLYLGLPSPSPSVQQPPHQLRGYSKLTLAPGQTRTVSMSLDERAFSYWDINAGGWRVAPGCYGVFAGSSSRDLTLHGAVGRGGATCATGPSTPAASSVPPVTAQAARPAGLANTATPSAALPAGIAVIALGATLLVTRRRRGSRLPG